MQSNRYLIVEEIGCQRAVKNMGASDALLNIWQVLLPLISVIGYARKCDCTLFPQCDERSRIFRSRDTSRILSPMESVKRISRRRLPYWSPSLFPPLSGRMRRRCDCASSLLSWYRRGNEGYYAVLVGMDRGPSRLGPYWYCSN